MSNQQPAVNDNPTVVIQLPLNNINLILGHLAQGKFAEVTETINSVREQAQAQLQAQERARQEAAADADAAGAAPAGETPQA